MRSLPPLLILLMAATPAHAWAGIQIPEPSNLALFALGLIGVAVGRRLSRHRRQPDDE